MNDSITSRTGKRVAVAVVLWGLLASFLVQWRTISQLRRENMAAGLAIKELQQAASVSADEQATVPGESTASASPGDPESTRKEHTELLRLRNEVRQLRERVAPPNRSPARRTAEQPPSGISDPTAFAQASPDPIARAELTSEWHGMEQVATNKYARALERLANAGRPEQYVERFHALGDVAKMRFAFGKAEDARASATEMLALAEKYKSEIWSKGACGQAVHDGNVVLGRVALEQGAIEDAKRYLLEAGTSTGSPVLGSFGPNMSLARELLEKGERDTVLQYLERCGKFWQADALRQWTDDVTAGRTPNFGANLFY